MSEGTSYPVNPIYGLGWIFSNCNLFEVFAPEDPAFYISAVLWFASVWGRVTNIYLRALLSPTQAWYENSYLDLKFKGERKGRERDIGLFFTSWTRSLYDCLVALWSNKGHPSIQLLVYFSTFTQVVSPGEWERKSIFDLDLLTFPSLSSVQEGGIRVRHLEYSERKGEINDEGRDIEID